MPLCWHFSNPAPRPASFLTRPSVPQGVFPQLPQARAPLSCTFPTSVWRIAASLRAGAVPRAIGIHCLVARLQCHRRTKHRSTRCTPRARRSRSFVQSGHRERDRRSARPILALPHREETRQTPPPRCAAPQFPATANDALDMALDFPHVPDMFADDILLDNDVPFAAMSAALDAAPVVKTRGGCGTTPAPGRPGSPPPSSGCSTARTAGHDIFPEIQQWPVSSQALLHVNDCQPLRLRIKTERRRRASGGKMRAKKIPALKPSNGAGRESPEHIGSFPDSARVARLERNRQTARDCRRRKKMYIQGLEHRVRDYEAREVESKRVIKDLRATNASLCQDLIALRKTMAKMTSN